MTTFKPILFSTPMVQAIADGRKTQTRRVIKPTSKKGCYGIQIERNKQTGEITNVSGYDENERTWNENGTQYPVNNKYQVGDILWVRETFGYNNEEKIHYAANVCSSKWDKPENGWKPSIHMPKFAARYFLEVTEVRVERLQDISEEDAIAEGAERGVFHTGPNQQKREFQLEINNHGTYQDGFKFIWQSIYGKDSWSENPFVWVYTFRKIETTPGTCFSCNCTDSDCRQCIEKTGAPCYWVNEQKTICNACWAQK